MCAFVSYFIFYEDLIFNFIRKAKLFLRALKLGLDWSKTFLAGQDDDDGDGGDSDDGGQGTKSVKS